MKKKWWMERVGYEIYIKSFNDSNGDGIGDLRGIEEKLDYIHELGVDLIWICPFYDSPMEDEGYDVRDFFAVAQEYGTLADFDRLLERAHDLGIRVIIDFVLNHTSDEHTWFRQSAADRRNPYRDYYIWHDGRIRDNERIEPTNWGSFFGGSAWQWHEKRQQYYMKIFSSRMPDLNWNNPAVRKDMARVGKWWLDRGVDGFRIDAVAHLDRAPLVDVEGGDGRYILDWKKFSNQPRVHEYLRELNEALFEPYDCLAIGEVGGEASISDGLKYASFDSGELDMVFNFDHNWCKVLSNGEETIDLPRLKRVFTSWQEAFKDEGWLPLNWLNHDQPRLLSHYGSKREPKRSAKTLATALYLMRGTPFIYQGEEIGMTNYPFRYRKEIRDVATVNRYRELASGTDMTEREIMERIAPMSRDHARTPMQWDSRPYAGFSTHPPWIGVNPNYERINVAKQQEDPESILNYYKRLISLRRTGPDRDLVIYGDYQPIRSDEKVYAYRRTYRGKSMVVICSFQDEMSTFDLSEYRIESILIANGADVGNDVAQLEPHGAIALRVEVKT
ncbi:MAG: glycoside hydrolase family 13 protein [Acholeplasmataceae bacterium]